uniref:Dedicator of cytokinesis protein 9-like isoform X3 n=1 Tax=Petromyzon marinus TaxID=7757 RepID=A0AAJ7U6J9_PETMA|nr:dedicator of cytokinesis protein 9-like isoform X3 [Petromyzon marinus]
MGCGTSVEVSSLLCRLLPRSCVETPGPELPITALVEAMEISVRPWMPVPQILLSPAQQVELVDYEGVVERAVGALDDSAEGEELRHLMLFPEDDVTLATEPRERRTLRSAVPELDGADATSLLVRECIKTYNSDWHVIKYKYEPYSGDVHRLPRKDLQTDRLVSHQFEIDELTENDEDSVSLASLRSGVTKQGWLYKGNFTSTSSVTMKTFKRRFFHLSQQPDGSYALNFYKDDKSLAEAKGSIFLDACLGVVPNARLRRHAFELKMMDRSSVVLAADSDAEVDEWRALLHKVLQGQFEAAMQDNKAQEADRRSRDDSDCPDAAESCESSDIQLQLVTDAKTHEETTRVSRKEGRLNVFVLTPEMQRMSPMVGEAEREARPPREKRASQLLVSCLGFNLAVQACFSDSGGVKSNVEPFFITLALYDLRTARKISADFHADLNPPSMRELLGGGASPEVQANGDVPTGAGGQAQRPGEPAPPSLPTEALLYPTQAVFTVCDPHPDVLLLVRVEKVLQGSVAQCTEPYLRADDTGKVAQKLVKQMRQYCGRMGQYHMPFCWAFRPLFRDVNGALDKGASFSPLFRQDGGRTSSEDWLRALVDVHKSEKMSKLQTIPGSIKITVESLPAEQPNMLTPGLSPVTAGWRLSETANNGGSRGGVGKRPCVREVDDFPAETARHAHPYSEYANRLYVYPQRLKYDAQKIFPKARNIAIHVEFRDSDEEGTLPLKCIYGKAGQPAFISSANTAVLHHQQCPDFCDEVKVELPVHLHGKHHLLFTFSHISCDLGKRRDTAEAEVGYAWLPLLREGRVRTGVSQLAVSATLPAEYLSCQNIGLGKFVGPEVKWVEGGKRLLTVSTHLVSSIYTKDQYLHNFMQQCEFTKYGTLTAPRDLLNSIKSLNAIEGHAMISFMPTLLTQLFRLLTLTAQEEILLTTTSFLVHFVDRCHEEEQDHHLHSYTRYVFKAEPWREESGRTVHEELVRTMELLLGSSVDQQLNSKLLKHLWFFFGIISKSMAQHVIENQRLPLKRSERFPASFHRNLDSMVTQLSKHVPRIHRDTGEDARSANTSLATFLMRCFTLMDRGFVFRLINSYITSFPIMDSKRTFDFRIEFLQIVCNYEHYVALNLPVHAEPGPAQRPQAPAPWEFRADDDFCRRRVLAGMLLREAAVAAGETLGGESRRAALGVVRSLLAKHSLDDRYVQPAQQARVAMLYLPILSILHDNYTRMCFQAVVTSDSNPIPQPSPREDVLNHALPKSASNTLEVAAFTFPSTLSVGAKRGDSRLSVASSDSNSSLHERRNTMDQAATLVLRPDVLHVVDVQTLLQCFLHVVKHAPQDALLNYWRKTSSNEILDFFGILELCLHQFKYLGKRHYCSSAGDAAPASVCAPVPGAQVKRSQTLPARRPPHTLLQLRQHGGLLGSSVGSEVEAQQQCLLAANLSTEVCLTVLDTMELYTHNYKERLLAGGGDGVLMQRSFGVYVTALRSGQSAVALGHVFASLHTFLNKFKVAFLRGRSELCGTLCLEALRCCGSRLGWAQACLLLHLLMRLNFEMSGRVAFSRTHTQVIVAVSRLMSEAGDLGGPRFQRALSTLNAYAASDATVRGSAFAGQVKELTKRVRAVLTATLQMKEHERDSEMMVDLQHSLATSYAGMAELRKAWLESMARMHERNGDLSEAAMCHIHIAALMAKYLKRRGVCDAEGRVERPPEPDANPGESSSNSTLHDTQSVLMQGVAAFESITPNVTDEETAEDDECGTQDVHFSEDMLVEQLETCAHMLERAERFELMADIYKMIIPIYEHRRDFQKLSDLYMALHKAYDQILDATRTCRRLLGTFFRVAFFGQAVSYFEEDEWKEYIYKEPKLTGLSEISQRLQLLYADKFGSQNVRIIQDSNPVDVSELDPRLAYIQITYVQPFFSGAEQAARRTDFERGHNVRRFVFETPYTASGRKHGDVTEQCKRRTVLTTSHTFPHVRKRVPVVARLHEELGPVQVAVDSMRSKVEELSTLCSESPANMIQLQLKLQGSVSTQVNAGPLAYARAFLDENNCAKYPEESVEELRDLFRQFVVVCGSALELNETLIKEDQQEYHEELKLKYGEMVQELSSILREMVMPQWRSLRNSAVRGSVHMYFNAVSQPASLRGVTGSSSSA